MSDSQIVTKDRTEDEKRRDAFYTTPLGQLLLIYQNTAANANYKDALDPEMGSETRAAWAASRVALDALIDAMMSVPIDRIDTRPTQE